ncbi:PAC2 family protein [uncultured archaeon]|nr:PAC2 family protein [uncultured archaeon]
MKETLVFEKKKMKLKDPIFITGLPGIGLVGQVVCKYLITKMGGTKLADVYSPHFPHQVLMTKKGAIRPIKNMFYHAKAGKRDLLLLVGDVQAISSEGQYEVAGKLLDYAQKQGVKDVISIGGYSTGKLNEKRKVFGVVTHKQMVGELKKFGVVFGEAKGAIVGAAGLLPALSKIKGMRGMCLMGETHGSYVDAVSASNVIHVLERLVGFTVDLKDLEKQAKEGEKIIKKIEEEMQKQTVTPYQSDKKDVSYIR